MGRYSSMLHNFLEKKSQVAFCQNACSKQILPLKHLPLNQPTAFLITRLLLAKDLVSIAEPDKDYFARHASLNRPWSEKFRRPDWLIIW